MRKVKYILSKYASKQLYENTFASGITHTASGVADNLASAKIHACI